jgi:cytochrome d ubiquinol oxidase subunit II
VPVATAAGDMVSSWLNPTSVLIGIVGVLTGAYLAAVYMAGDSQRAGVEDLVQAFRTRALGAGVVTGVAALVGLLVVRSDARDLYDGLTSGGGLAMVILSALAGLATMALVWAERYGLARVTAAGAVAAIVVGWMLAQKPYILPGHLTLDQAKASDATLSAVVIGVAAGMVILAPSLWFLYRLVLQGRLDQEYEPLDQRFHT